MSLAGRDKANMNAVALACPRQATVRGDKAPRPLAERLTDWKYVAARLVRRYLVPNRMLSLLPGYAVSQNEIEPCAIVDKYLDYLNRLKINLSGARILEIGMGATNSTGYELAARAPISYWLGYDPFSSFNRSLDRRILNIVADRRGLEPGVIAKRTKRLDRLDDLSPGSVDVILSHCVLEHVRRPEELFNALAGLLISGGKMIHAVDYRDHYFRYPFHFLKFSDKTWRRWLDPGDLPRHRLFNHVDIINGLGLNVEIIETRLDPDNFFRVEPWVRPVFKRGTPEDAAEWAVLAVTTGLTPER